MIIDGIKDFIFIDVPGTSGKLITEALGHQVGITRLFNPVVNTQALFGTNTFASHLKNFMDEDEFTNVFSFAVVRNPWERLFALYQEIVTNDAHPGYDDLIDKGFKHYLFEYRDNQTMVAEVNKLEDMSTDYFFVNPQDTPQLKWITDDSNNIIVDSVGRYEDLRNYFNEIISTLEIDAELPEIEIGEQDYRDVYDNDMIDFVSELHQNDIEEFEYTFDVK